MKVNGECKELFQKLQNLKESDDPVEILLVCGATLKIKAHWRGYYIYAQDPLKFATTSDRPINMDDLSESRFLRFYMDKSALPMLKFIVTALLKN